MARRMAEAHFRSDQRAHRYDNHIAPINRLVDELRGGDLWLPYVAPMYGGVNARLLSILRDPGPKTQDKVGSGFLCMENDDATAEAICKLFEDAGIDPCKVVPWNAYPWYINRKPRAAELEAGVEPLKRLIDLMPNLQVVMLHGGDAHNGWKRFERRYPNLASERALHVIKTYHTSRQAFWHKDPEVRKQREEHLRSSFHEAGHYLNESEPEEFKKFDDITQPDERHGLLGALTGMPLTLEWLYSAVEKIELNQSVPVELRSQFNVARNLALYTWFSYSLDPVAQLKSYILIEHALNIKDGSRDRPLKKILKRAVSEGWISDSGFRHVTFDPKEPQKYCASLVETLPSLRNEAAHGSTMLCLGAVSHLQICADFVNQLFK